MSTDDTTTTSRPEAAGRREDRDGLPHVVIERTFRAPVTDVWAAVTEPARLERWIGTWAGDPASGTVQFRMTAEGEDIAAEPMTVHECDPPRRLVLSWMSGATGGRWHVELDLVEADGVTTLTFAQRVPTPQPGATSAPGGVLPRPAHRRRVGRRRRRRRVARLRGHGWALRAAVRRPRLRVRPARACAARAR